MTDDRQMVRPITGKVEKQKSARMHQGQRRIVKKRRLSCVLCLCTEDDRTAAGRLLLRDTTKPEHTRNRNESGRPTKTANSLGPFLQLNSAEKRLAGQRTRKRRKRKGRKKKEEEEEKGGGGRDKGVTGHINTSVVLTGRRDTLPAGG
ncbi:unnamed protein product [Pleuronectes platessa]|uniref:Uncharacterized protein n=1 Tax=Pleuronectes platessa TaxID=8262 RepID=A0A9N7ZCC9_PLEPL|nr:unnamed protein product [Pleuronectes platessa]